MPSQYERLSVTALRLSPNTPIERTYHKLRFPGSWKPALRLLAEARREGQRATIPVQSLNEALAALVPDVISTLRYIGFGDDDEDWLLAREPVDSTAIFNIVGAWVRAWGSLHPTEMRAALAAMSPGELTWNRLTVDLGAREHRALAMTVLPHEAAAALTTPGLVCPHGDLELRRCNTDNGAEVMSWPPFGIDDRLPRSVTISITVQTHPDSDELFLYLDFGMRRWMHTTAKLAHDHGHNVYLAPTIPYVRGANASRAFGRAAIRRVATSDPNSERTYRTEWRDRLADVLRELGCLTRLPDPQQLADRPMDHLKTEGDASALVYSTGMLGGDKEQISPGLTLADRAPLMRWVAQTLAPDLLPLDPLPKVKRCVYKHTDECPNIEHTRGIAQAIQHVVGSRLSIELWTDTIAATQYALGALAERLGVAQLASDQLGEEELLLDLGPLTIGLRKPDTAALTGDLDRGPKTSRMTVQKATEARLDLIEQCIPRATHPTVALVEISGPEAYQGSRRGDDPKFAIRHGLVRTGRLSQFITPVIEPKPKPPRKDGRKPSDPNKERFGRSVDELFRQLGVRPAPLPAPAAGTLDRQPALLAIWIIRQNKGKVWGVQRQVPIAILIHPDGCRIQIRAPKVDWQPLHTGLLEVGQMYVNADLKCGQDDIKRFISSTIADVVDNYADTLLLTHAQNLRPVWPDISNSRIVLDTIGFGQDQACEISEYPGLRHVRIRTSENSETPECYGVSETDHGQPQGLWRFHSDRAFGSTAPKPVSANKAVKSVSKISQYEYNGVIKAPNPNQQVWNQQLIEIFVAAVQPEDNIDDWAALAHDLRFTAPYIADITSLPWPLHLATKIEEYLLPKVIS